MQIYKKSNKTQQYAPKTKASKKAHLYRIMKNNKSLLSIVQETGKHRVDALGPIFYDFCTVSTEDLMIICPRELPTALDGEESKVQSTGIAKGLSHCSYVKSKYIKILLTRSWNGKTCKGISDIVEHQMHKTRCLTSTLKGCNNDEQNTAKSPKFQNYYFSD